MPNVLAAALKTAFSAYNHLARPTTTGTLRLPGLIAPVEVVRDRWGIPHIYARSNHDLFAAQGYVHAQDRLWQMHLNRLTAQGRLASVFGELALDTDRLTRTLGFWRLALADYAGLGPHELALLGAYAAGVNACLAAGRLPIEFQLLGLRPEPWAPVDTMGIARLMIFNLSTGWASELVRAQLVEQLGAERAADLDLRWPERDVPTLPEGLCFNRLAPDNMLVAERGPFLGRGLDGGGHGSNAWVLAGWRTTTGKPLLCNDMHLKINAPSLWYTQHLAGGDYQVAGAGLPGVTGVQVGFNARIAWGCTLAFTDAQDLFVERLDPAGGDRYGFRGEWLDCQVLEEEIRVKGRAVPHVERVRLTHHGPIVGGLVKGAEQSLALNSYALRPAPAYIGFMRLNRAGGWDEFVQSMAEITAPQLNVSYADVDGNIGHWVCGTLPVRAQGQGTLPVPGWTGEHEWVGEVPFDDMPHALNPACGYIVSCNHQLMPETLPSGQPYPHFLGLAWMNGYRAQRIVSEIERMERLAPEDCRKLQLDVHSLAGLALVERLRRWGFTAASPEARQALDCLLGWDGWLGAGSAGGAVYQVVLRRLTENLVAPALGSQLFARFCGCDGPHPLLAPTTEFLGHASVTVLALLDDEALPWVAEAGGRGAVLEASLAEAARWLSDTLGPDPAGWQWGRLHQATARHALALRKPLDDVFNVGPAPIGGDTDTVCQTAFMPDAPYHPDACAPSYRQVVDLGDLSRSHFIAPPGNSGRLGDRHYDDLFEPWLQGELVPALWEREAVEAALEARLVLEP
jgi:penicillin G amidase